MSQQLENIFNESEDNAPVSKQYLDTRLGELSVRLEKAITATGAKIAGLNLDIGKWMLGALCLQTLAILGGVAALLRLHG